MNGSVARPGPEIHRPGTLPATGRPFSDGPAPFPAARFRLRQPGAPFRQLGFVCGAPRRLFSAARFRLRRHLVPPCAAPRHLPWRRHTRSRCKIRVKPASDTYPDYGRIYPIYGLSARQARRPKTASAHPPACAASRAPQTDIPIRRHSAPAQSTTDMPAFSTGAPCPPGRKREYPSRGKRQRPRGKRQLPRQKKTAPRQKKTAPRQKKTAPSDPLPGEGCCPISYSVLQTRYGPASTARAAGIKRARYAVLNRGR